jgi:hypothetical protein
VNRQQRRAMRPSAPANVDRVVLGYVHPGEVSAAFMASVDRMKRYELLRTGQYVGTLERIAGSGNIYHSRNLITKIFLEDKEADWLWFVDADMGFPEWALQRLLGAADKNERPVVGGLCFGLATIGWDEITYAEQYESFPTIGYWNFDEAGTIVGYRYLTEYPDDTVCKVDTSGAACVLIHRSALEKIGRDWWTHKPAPDIPSLNGRMMFGEDISFFIRCYENDVPVWLDTAVKTSHHKGGIYLTHEQYQQQERRKALLKRLDDAVDAGEMTAEHARAAAL